MWCVLSVYPPLFLCLMHVFFSRIEVISIFFFLMCQKLVRLVIMRRWCLPLLCWWEFLRLSTSLHQSIETYSRRSITTFRASPLIINWHHLRVLSGHTSSSWPWRIVAADLNFLWFQNIIITRNTNEDDNDGPVYSHLMNWRSLLQSFLSLSSSSLPSYSHFFHSSFFL